MRRLLLIGTFGVGMLAAQTRFTAPDNSVSFAVPAGWSAQWQAGTVRLVKNGGGDAQMFVARIPDGAGASLIDGAEAMASVFRRTVLSFRLANFRNVGKDLVTFRVSYGDPGDAAYVGPGVVIEKSGARWWVSEVSSQADATAAARVESLARSINAAAAASGSAPAAPVRNPLANAAPAPAAAPASAANSGANPFIGSWSTVNFFGDIVDRGTGEFLYDSNSGEWYVFNANGTYKHTRIGSGLLISGAWSSEGTYQAAGDRILLRQRIESWFPRPRSAAKYPAYRNKAMPKEITLSVGFESADKLRIHDGSSGMTFTRGRQ